MSAPAPDADGGPDLHSGVLDEVGRHLLRLVDNEHGGIGGAPKFPQPFVFTALWRFYLRRGDDNAKAAVELTLNRICQGGIYDHLGGGFARYSTDAEWLAPSVEAEWLAPIVETGWLAPIVETEWLAPIVETELLKLKPIEKTEWLKLKPVVADPEG